LQGIIIIHLQAILLDPARRRSSSTLLLV
jgi:hypothetical protein